MTPTVTTTEAQEPQGRRRSREDLEALAAKFVSSEVSSIVRKRSVEQKRFNAAGVVAAVAFAGAVIWVALPEGAPETGSRQAAAAQAADEAALLARKLEAERERQRGELQRSREFMEKVAAEEAAALRDMEQRARALESKAAAAGPAERPSPAAQAPAMPPAAAPVTAQPATVAKADAPAVAELAAANLAAQKEVCTIHVSELSSSGRLTYADVARMQGVRKDERTGHVFTRPVQVQSGRWAVFEVMPSGCVRVQRMAGSR